MNFYKIATVILIIIIVLLSFNLYQQSITYNFGGFEISKKQFDSITAEFGEDSVNFDICKIGEGGCVRVTRFRE